MNQKLSPIQILQKVLVDEAQALQEAAQRINAEEADKLERMFRDLIQEDGHLIFCGVGKSGFVARKLASTFTSLQRPSVFLHPTEALHGDLGIIRKQDVVVLISKSGTTDEILKLLPYIHHPAEKIVGLIGEIHSPLAKRCGVLLNCQVEKEACLNNQAPTTSSTLALAMGDAMAVLYEAVVGLSKEGFALSHPGGILGKALRMKVADIMRPIEECPVMGPEQSLKEALLAMTAKNVGGLAVIPNFPNPKDGQQKLLGIVVEGDIRRTFAEEQFGLHTQIKSIMNPNPITVFEDELASAALELMEQRKNPLNILPVIDRHHNFKGFLRLHDLLKEGFKK